MPGSNHRVRRVVFDVTCEDESTAFKARRRLKSACGDTLASLLGDAFDAYSPNGQAHRIDRIEVDLGVLDLDRMNDLEIRDLVLRRLAGALVALPRDEVDLIPDEVSAVEALIEFLQTGRLPWGSPAQGIEELELLIQRLGGHEQSRLAKRLIHVFRARQTRIRLAQQFSLQFFLGVVRQVRPEAAEIAGRAVSEAGGDLTSSEWRTIALEAVIASLETPIEKLESILAVAIRDIAGAATTEDVTKPAEESPVDSKSDVLYTRSAGLVLLHPFLPRFFEAVALLDSEGAFRGLDARIRAVHLLSHLAGGSENPEEHELLLEKILCGYALEAPITKEVLLTEMERTEAETLLREVIRQWDRLKHTSPDGLRQGFLRREGRLRRAGAEWDLTVEERGIDVLMASLPWSIRRVEFPWMTAGIRVEWI